MTTMMTYQHAVDDTAPDSPPELSESKSSKASSLNSLESDDNGALSDVGDFEEIGLDDDQNRGPTHQLKVVSSPYGSLSTSDLTAASLKHLTASTARAPYTRDVPSRSGRDIVSLPKSRPAFPSLKKHVTAFDVRTANVGLMPDPYAKPARRRSLSRSPSSASAQQHRSPSPSPSIHLDPKDPKLVARPRRSSWQANQRRKSAIELELECDEDDGDDIPDGLFLDNVPISPRPVQERTKSQASSKAPSPERERPPKSPKDRVRSVGNGTPPVAVAQGCLKSPMWKSDTAVPTLKSRASSAATSPVKSRAQSWTAALAGLNAEAKALTEKLEEHADEMEHKAQRSSTGSIPTARKSSEHYDAKARHKSALAELPPLRRTNVMIDPLPVSKEKEAVLSRTRPSWLPPKDPAEERRHLKEYMKMMARSAEADKRREASRRVRSEQRDKTVDGLQYLWEEDILPRWTDAIRERRTRELWWRGVAPRSRGLVWSRAVGNELGLTETSYEAALGRAHEVEARVAAGNGSAEDISQAAWFADIRKDVEERTWKDLRIFQEGAPLHQGLVDVLRAYAMYRSDIGYVTGCNTIAALLLLNLPSPAVTFTALANMLNRSLPLSFYVCDPGAKVSAYNLLLQTLSHKSQSLFDHLTSLPDHDPDSYLGDMFSSLFTDHLALDEAARLWDVYVFEGDAILVRAGVALLLQKEMSLLGAKTLDDVKAVLATSSLRSSTETPVVSGNGDEDRWIKAVREAGKA